MTRCEYCSMPGAGLSDQHDFCAKAAASGKSREEIAELVKESYSRAPVALLHPLRFKHIVWGVFFGMWLFAITGGIVLAIYAAVFGSTR